MDKFSAQIQARYFALTFFGGGEEVYNMITLEPTTQMFINFMVLYVPKGTSIYH